LSEVSGGVDTFRPAGLSVLLVSAPICGGGAIFGFGVGGLLWQGGLLERLLHLQVDLLDHSLLAQKIPLDLLDVVYLEELIKQQTLMAVALCLQPVHVFAIQETFLHQHALGSQTPLDVEIRDEGIH